METQKLSVGDQLEAHCTKCRVAMNHTLVALVDERPVRVKCNTCGGEHLYHPPREAPKKKPATAPAKKAAPRTRLDPRDAERREWEALEPELDHSKAVSYSMDGCYPLNSLITHPVFGLGLVQQVSGEKKICVLFRDGRRTLRCQ